MTEDTPANQVVTGTCQIGGYRDQDRKYQCAHVIPGQCRTNFGPLDIPDFETHQNQDNDRQANRKNALSEVISLGEPIVRRALRHVLIQQLNATETLIRASEIRD